MNVNQYAAKINEIQYDEKATRQFVSGAPHLKHSSLRSMYVQMYEEIVNYAKKHAQHPKILDLGAGEGSVTQEFLKLGATVTSVDISESQLKELRRKCSNVIVHCEDVEQFLRNNQETYDVIVFSAFLHHVPDYLSLIESAIRHLSPHGQVAILQEEMQHSTQSRITYYFSEVAYCCWRFFQGNIIDGIKRRIRRGTDHYNQSTDQMDYHCIRDGMDQYAIERLLLHNGLKCNIKKYYSTQGRLFQLIGERLMLQNTFSIIGSL